MFTIMTWNVENLFQPQPSAQNIPEFEADMLEAEIEMAQGDQPPQG